MNYLIPEEVQGIVRERIGSNLYFCPYCLSALQETDEGTGESTGIYYCPNEMCLYDEQGRIEKED